MQAGGIGVVAAAGFALALVGCAVTPEARTRAALADAGVKPSIAACMAERMIDRLSLIQLRRLGRISKAPQSDSLDQFLYRARSLGDAETLGVVTTSAGLCWLRD